MLHYKSVLLQIFLLRDLVNPPARPQSWQGFPADLSVLIQQQNRLSLLDYYALFYPPDFTKYILPLRPAAFLGKNYIFAKSFFGFVAGQNPEIAWRLP